MNQATKLPIFIQFGQY